MSKKRHPRARSYLWGALSTYHFLLDDIATEEIVSRSRAWISIHAELGNVLIDQIYGQLGEAFNEDQIDALISQWADVLKSIAQEASVGLPMFRGVQLLYVCYCSWLAKVISRFNAMMQTDESTTPRLREEYQESVILAQQLEQLLTAESNYLDQGNHNRTHWQEVESQTGALAEKWRVAVLSSA